MILTRTQRDDHLKCRKTLYHNVWSQNVTVNMYITLTVGDNSHKTKSERKKTIQIFRSSWAFEKKKDEAISNERITDSGYHSLVAQMRCVAPQFGFGNLIPARNILTQSGAWGTTSVRAEYIGRGLLL